MGFFDKLKAGWDNVSRSTDLMQKIQKGEMTSLSDDDRKFFEEYNKKAPEAYLEEWEEQQAQKAEKEKERALQKAEIFKPYRYSGRLGKNNFRCFRNC